MGSTDHRPVVSTQCPTCGASLDFSEGSNSVACAYCRSALLVTGRGRLLTYVVMPRVEARDAFAVARFAEPSSGAPLRLGRTRLFFLPYYRFRALELRWQRADPGTRPRVDFNPEVSKDYRPAISIEQVLADLAPDPEDVEMRERHVEKNFLALDLPAVELLSLGLRTTTLKLSLCGREALQSLGIVVAPEMPADEALERGERSIEAHNVAHRALLGRALSLVYFPFWMIDVERPGQRGVTIIDGVSRAVVARGVARTVVDRLRAATTETETIGFRPLVCPNCGWSLPLRPEDFIFYCSTCFRAWKIVGEELLEIARRFAAAPDSRVPTAKHFPFWMVYGRLEGRPQTEFFSAAFLCRRLKVLSDLSASLSRKSPRVVDAPEPPREAHGAYFDEQDAAALTLFAHTADEGERFDDVERRASEQRLTVEEAKLVWMPFASEPYAYRDAFTGASVPKNLVL